MSAPSALDALRRLGVQIASDTAEFNQIREFVSSLTDATTNPSLVFAAVSKPEYAHLAQEAVEFARKRLPLSVSVKDVAALAMDRLLAQVTAQIARIVSGRVSVSVDPRLAYDTDAIMSKARTLVSLLVELGIPRRRVLVKIPATYEGIRAARALALAPEPIHSNMTLVFGRVQAVACAQAGVAVISPFIGRVKDWWDVKHPSATSADLVVHPGIRLVRAIRAAYIEYGTQTEILAAGFRAPEEVIELGAYGPRAGPDAVTIPPNLISALRGCQWPSRPPLDASLLLADANTPADDELYFGVDVDGAAAYARDILREEIASVKVPEGLAKFAADAQAMEEMLRRRVGGSVIVNMEVSAVL